MSTQSPWQTSEEIDNSPNIPPSLDGLGILVVDDQIDHLQLMQEILVGAGYKEVFTAANGEEAFEALDEHSQIGLVLLDLGLPGMDGYEVCRTIKSNPSTQDVCVIVVTGGAIQIDAALCKSFESGAIDFISKPLNRFDLLARCQSALNLYNDKQQNLSQELDLILREEKYRSLFENSLDGILILNPLDLVVRDLNASAVSLFGFDSQDLIGKAFTSLSPKNLIPEIYKEVGALSDGNNLTLETQKVKADGKSLTVEIKFSSFLLQGEDRIMAVVSDVSKRLQSSEVLRLSEERMALAVLDKKNGIWDWDIAGGSIYFSENWRKFFGISKNDSSNGMDFWNAHLHPDELDVILKSMRDHWSKSGSLYIEEHRLLGNSGKYRWVLSRGKAVRNESGEVVRMTGTLTDITEKKHLEIQLVQKQKMEGLDRFAGGVAQDLNQMFSEVNSRLRAIEDAVPNHTVVGQCLNEIRQSTEHPSSLIKQLLAFSRKSQIQLEYVFLNLEIQGLLNMVKSVITDSIKLDTELEEELPPISADHAMISQVLLNLVNNSCDAMPVGGKLSISTSLHTLDESFFFDNREMTPGDYLKLSVGDEGVGMDDATTEKIFEPFFSTKKSEDGQSRTGLGLSTVYGIINQHRGWISVKSRPGIGTRIDLFFPVLNESENKS